LPLLAAWRWQWRSPATFVKRPRLSMRACIALLKAKMMEQRYVHLINPFVWSTCASSSLFDASFIVTNHCFSGLFAVPKRVQGSCWEMWWGWGLLQ
jgi:hypothetical protein